MNKTYSFSYYNRYSNTTEEYQITLPESFVFAECLDSIIQNKGKHYLCVVNNASEYKDIIKTLEENEIPICIYYLPYNTAVLSLSYIKFSASSTPTLISIEALNDKLKEIKENVVWVKLQADSHDILSVYRLSWVEGEEYITTCAILNKSIYQDKELPFKSICFRDKSPMLMIEEKVYDDWDKITTKTLIGDEAKTLWSSLLGKALKNIEYNPDLDDSNYDYNKLK